LGANVASIQKRTWTDKKGKQKTSYRVQIRRHGLPPVTETFDRKTDADRWARDTEADLQRGLRFPQHEAEKRTLAELVDRQLEHVKLHRPHDYDRQRVILNWWKEKIGTYTLATISVRPDLLGKARDELLTEGSAPATVVRYMAGLSKAFSNAVKEWHWLRDNPLRNISKPQEPRGRMRYLDDEERPRLLAACRRSEYKALYLVVLWLITTGMRRGELFGLRWQDVDLERRVAVLQDTKNGDRRSVPIIPEVVQLLREHGKVRTLNQELIFAPTSADMWLFDKAWYAALREAKIKDFRLHDLRHCAASYAAMSGASVPELAALLGHKTLAMVKRYSHLSDQHTGEVVERMHRKFFS
jgi:integrase